LNGLKLANFLLEVFLKQNLRHILHHYQSTHLFIEKKRLLLYPDEPSAFGKHVAAEVWEFWRLCAFK